MSGVSPTETDTVESSNVMTAAGPGVTLNDTLAVAGRRILRYEVELLAPEEWHMAEGVRAHRTHQLRVVTRRLRSTLRVFKPYYKAKAVQPIAKGVRDLAAVLATVRELDVSIRALRDFQESCDGATGQGLQVLLEAWQAQRRERRAGVQGYLEGPQHARWLETLQQFTQTDEYDRALQVGKPYYLRHAIDEIMAGHIARVRTYDTLPALPDLPRIEDLHAVRLAVKRLRYVTDALREVLPPERAEQIVATCAIVQDAYGVMHDAHWVAGRALGFMVELRAGAPSRETSTGERSAASDALVARSILAFAESQQRAAEEQLSRWRQTLDSLLVL